MANNRIFIVTTRRYPVESGDYQPIGPSYHDTFSNDAEAREKMFDHPDAEWKINDRYQYYEPLPIKCRVITNSLVYVAPCLGENITILTSDKKDKYIESVLQSVLEDLGKRKVEEFDAYLFIHDGDFGESSNNHMTKDEYGDDGFGGVRHLYSEYHEKLFGELDNIETRGYYYQHTDSSIYNFVKFIIGEKYNEESMSSLETEFNVLWKIFNSVKNKITPDPVIPANQKKQPVEPSDKKSIKEIIKTKIKDFANNANKTIDTINEGPVRIKVRKHSWKKKTPANSFEELIKDICCDASMCHPSVRKTILVKKTSANSSEEHIDICYNTPRCHQSAKFDTKHHTVPVINIFDKPLENLIAETDVRFGNFFDSSIWNYSLIKGFKFDEQLDGIINEIIGYTSKHYYELKVSREFVKLNLNLFNDSHLSGSHGEHVVPFLFHSESKHKELAKKKYVKNEEEKDKNFICGDGSFTHKWRILLLDDHALCPMSRIGNEETTAKEKTSRIEYIDKTPDKLRIISDDLRLLYPEIKIGYVKSDDGDKPIYDELTNESVDKDESYDIVFYCLSSVCKAISALESHRFEIVLLDYLLGEKDDGTREYSYELLKKIEIRYKENEKENKADLIFGPHRRLYFSFISAFTTAVNERLLAEGLHKSEKFWHIADGACPTNTPYLFLYNLLHLMNKRVEDMGLHKLSDISKDRFANSWIKENIINEIYGKEEDEGKKVKVRQNANETFDEVLSLLYHYKKLLDDVHNTDNVFNSTGSVLATDFVKKNPNLGGFLEHLTQLVYLTAFGTVRQWPEMWEEYLFISSIIGPQQKVEEYIMKLKSNNI